MIGGRPILARYSRLNVVVEREGGFITRSSVEQSRRALDWKVK